MSKPKTQSGLAKYSWGILIGMAGFPILAILWKAFPNLTTVFTGLAIIFALLTLRSLIGLLFPRNRRTVKEEPALH